MRTKVAVGTWLDGRRRLQWQEDIGRALGQQSSEAANDADDDRRLVVDAHRAIDDGGIRGQDRSPQALADDQRHR